jgi:hypothetical protein
MLFALAFPVRRRQKRHAVAQAGRQTRLSVRPLMRAEQQTAALIAAAPSGQPGRAAACAPLLSLLLLMGP